MENYLKTSAVKKLFDCQKEDFENQVILVDKNLKDADYKEGEKFEAITDKLKTLLDDNEYAKVNDMIIQYELFKFNHEDLMFYLFYKLALKDGISLKNLN